MIRTHAITYINCLITINYLDTINNHYYGEGYEVIEGGNYHC